MFLGIDIHKREAQVAVRNDDGDMIEQVRVKNTDLEEIAQRYAGGEALLEATTNYFYIYDILSECSFNGEHTSSSPLSAYLPEWVRRNTLSTFLMKTAKRWSSSSQPANEGPKTTREHGFF